MLSFSTVEILDLKIMLPKEDSLSTSSEATSNPEDKENSDDDDDRNHKHRRRDDRENFFDDSSCGQLIKRPNRKRNEKYSGQLFIETGPHSHEVQKEAPSKFEKRHLGNPSSLHSPFDLNSRPRSNTFLQTDLTNSSVRAPLGRGRGRNLPAWNQSDSGFCSLDSIDFGSHMTSQRPIHTGLFAGGSQNVPWGAFGFIHGLSNGLMDPRHPMGLQPALRPTMNHASLGMTRQRCRDFEERGFCLRGDMCPMEHGMNRIVVEDVQSLSQFNLPVSIPTSLAVGAQAGLGPSHTSSSSSSLLANKNLLFKNSKAALNMNAVRMNAPSSVAGVEADVYDPDQPLWNNSNKSAVLQRQSSPSTQDEALCVADSSRKSSRNDNAARNIAKEARNDNEATALTIRPSEQGKLVISEEYGMKTAMAATQLNAMPTDLERRSGKLQQKAQRTLYVCGIPLKNNRREALHSHFQKFGQVIDIYIPNNGEKAFVQYTKREEAEAALKSPDAVMGNRFIKLFWANRDNINNEGQGGGEAKMSTVGVANSIRMLPQAVDIGKKSLSLSAKKDYSTKAVEILTSSIGGQKGVTLNSPKLLTSPKKKIENLGLLEELRRKQELLAKKRDEFRRQLIKFERQASIKKNDATFEQVAKKQKTEIGSCSAKASDSGESKEGESLPNNCLAEALVSPPNNCLAEALVSPRSESPAQIIRPVTRIAVPNPNLFKLDNRPASFRILPPLPEKLGNVTVLKDHFSKFGDLISIVFEESEEATNSSSKQLEKSFVCVTYGTLHSAEKAYQAGKYCKGCFLKFVWVTSCPVSEKKVEDGGAKTCLLSSSSAYGASSALSVGDPTPIIELEIDTKEVKDNCRDIKVENCTMSNVPTMIENVESGLSFPMHKMGIEDTNELLLNNDIQ